ncbi:DUF3800 domain-containing protein [Patescibacteria group bacterium]|nr:DUF3800 domain-containing protein [Patescibacteria group bacterium]MBU1256210.1 DUF3800 domain-containing protein [Patescibacteria group bacterium]MBU1457803.1 DUF3800 domain-containing protein [Patescibacteria group bacterium]
MNLATLFIDESGKSSLVEKASEPFILTGIILDEDDKQIVEGFFGYIKLKYDIDPTTPFHSYDIFENDKTKLPNSELISLSIKLAEFISLIPAKMYVIVIDKKEFKNALGIKSDEDFKGSSKKKELKQFPYRIMATYLFGVFGKYLEKNNKIGQAIADSRRGADYELIRTLSIVKQGHAAVKKDVQDSIKSRLNALCFAEKGFLSGGVEITDLISYISFIRARKLLTKFSDTGVDKIWPQIKSRAKFVKLNENQIRKFFGIKKGEVHKYLKTT